MMDYLTNPADRAILGSTPMLMAPRFGQLPEIEVGATRYLAASDGIYIESRTPALHLCMKLAGTPPMPYGAIKPFVRLAGGPIPHEVIEQARREAVAHMPNEWGGAICWTPERGYWLEQPDMLHQSAGSVSYRNTINENERVIDIHSHGALPAFFSSVDDRDDREAGGVYLAAVIGKANPVDCSAVADMNTVIRAVINGQLITIAGESRPWETEPATEGVAG